MIQSPAVSDLAFCAMRYALGRQTYIVQVVVGRLHEVWPQVYTNIRKQILNEIGYAIDHGKAGHEMDVKEWLGFVNWAMMQEESADDPIL